MIDVTTLIGLSVLAVYIVLGYFVTKFIRKQIMTMKPYSRLVILSLSYTLIFGVGIAGGGGDPGFAFPCPIIFSFFLANPDFIIRLALIPFAFWWILIFMVMLIRHIWTIMANKRRMNCRIDI